MKAITITTWSVAAGFVFSLPLYGMASGAPSEKRSVQVAPTQTVVAAERSGQGKAPDRKETRGKKHKTRKVAVPKYKPPRGIGRPWPTEGGGTRGPGTSLPAIAVLAPDTHTGLTTREQPTLYWFISVLDRTPIEFTLIHERGIHPLVETRLKAPDEPGLQRVALADLGVRLAVGERYQWSIALVRDPQHRSKDIVAMGGIKRIEPSEMVSARVANTAEMEAPGIYAEMGLWYEALTAVSELIAADPTNRNLRRQRAALLEQVRLLGLAAHDTISAAGNRG